MGSTRCYIHTRTQGFGGSSDGKEAATNRTLEALSFRSLRQMGNMMFAMGGNMSDIIEKKENKGSNVQDIQRKRGKEQANRESRAPTDGTNPASFFRKYTKKHGVV